MSGYIATLREQPSHWSPKTWYGFDGIRGINVWTDGTNIYFSESNDQYVLNKETSTWVPKTWYGNLSANLEGDYIWSDGDNIYFSYGAGRQYVLNKETDTWIEKTWNVDGLWGIDIWIDGDNIYYSQGDIQYVLNKETDTWILKTWYGDETTPEGYEIWFNNGNIYYTTSGDTYILDRSTDTWTEKIWDGISSIPSYVFTGYYIWSDGIDSYLSNYEYQYVLNKDIDTWVIKEWAGGRPTSVSGIWSDGDNIYYSYGYEYILDIPSTCKKMRKGWIEAADKSKLYKVTDVTATPCSWDLSQVCTSLVYDGDIYVFSPLPRNVYDHLYVFHNSSWSEWGLPYSMRSASYIVYDGKLHIMGGGWNDEPEARYHYTLESISFTNYTINWHREEDLPFDLIYSSRSTVIYNNKIYIVGGKFTSQSLYSYDGTTWTLEATLPYECINASAVVYNNKIHIVGCSDYPDSHYSWNGSTWSRESTMPFNNYGGPSIEYRESIHVIYGDDHYVWRGYEWTKITDAPAHYYYPSLIIYDDNILHLIGVAGNGYPSAESNHYVYNWKQHVWGTDIEIKESVQYNNVSIYDDIRIGTTQKRIKKGWVGELNGEPKLVLRSIPVIDDVISFGNSLPNDMAGGDPYSTRLAAISLYDRVHVLGGSGNIHYSFKVSYDTDPLSEYIGRPIALDMRKEAEIPYKFCGDTAFVMDDDTIHIFGSNYQSNLQNKHYIYRSGVWSNVNESSHASIYPNKSVVVQVDNKIYVFYEDKISKYTWNSSSDSGSWSGTGSINNFPIYIDNSVTAGWSSAVYDKDNNRIVLVYYNNGSTYFYAFDLSYDDGTSYTSLISMANHITLIKTVSMNYFIHPLYVDENTVSNGGDSNIYILSYAYMYKWIENDTSYGGTWSPDLTAPYNFHDGCAVVYNNKIHVLGGDSAQDTDAPTNHYSYDLILNRWSYESTLPFAFQKGCAIVYDNKIHILGSMISGYSDSHYSWDGTSWHTESILPYEFYGGQAVVYDNKIHILGGSLNNGYYQTLHFSWEPSEGHVSNTWNSEGYLPYALGTGSALVYNGEIHILGSSTTSYKRSHYSWNGSQWTEYNELPYDFSNGSAVVDPDGNSIHIFGGDGNSSTIPYYHYESASNDSWIQRRSLPTSFSMGGLRDVAVVAKVPSERYIVGWTGENYSLSYTGLGAFSTTSDPSLSNCIAWTWGGRYPYGTSYSTFKNDPAVTVTHNGRIFMMNIDRDWESEPVLNELKLSRWTYYSATFDHYDDDVLGRLNINNVAYNNHNLYTYGGYYNTTGVSSANTMYFYNYDSRRSVSKWQKINITSLDGLDNMNFNLDKSTSTIYSDYPLIFVDAEYGFNYNNEQIFQDMTLMLSINSLGVLSAQLFGKWKSPNSGWATPNDKLYGLNHDRCYGIFVYNNVIYFLGGAYSTSVTSTRITKFDPINRTLEYVGRIWDTHNNTMISSPITLPYNSNSPYKLEKFGYGVIGDDLHIVYVQNGIVYHKILDLVTEANYYQFDNKKELPLLEPLRDATAPPSTFCGPCFTSDSDGFFMALCRDGNQYMVYNLVEYQEHVVIEDIGLDTYDYACRWELIDNDLEIYDEIIKHITLNQRSNSIIQNIEIITEDNGIAEQYEATLDEYFN